MKVILLAIRTLLRFRLYTAINILGLSLSLACCILIFRYVHSEVTTDHFIKELDRVCYICMDDENSHQTMLRGLTPTDAYTPNPLADPAVELYSIFYENGTDQIFVNNKTYNVASVAADTNYLKIVTLPILKSVRTRLLERPEDAIISESLAATLFGKEDPIGKEIRTSTGGMITVSGIMGKPDTRFSMPVDLVMSSQIADYSKIMQSSAIVRLQPGTNPEQVNRTYETFRKFYNDDKRVRFRLFPLEKLYFDNHIVAFQQNRLKGNLTHLLILSAIAGLILIIGLFNFINIYTVLVMKRAREFGMKKVFGAGSRQVALQLFAENLTMTTLALCLAWAFVEVGTKLLYNWLPILVPANQAFNIGLSAVILFLLPVVTSVYPYLQYNYTLPIVSIRSIGRSGGSTVSRSIFLCLQYTLTILLIVTAMYSVRQLNYMLSTDPGFKTDNIMMIPPLNSPTGSNMDLWKQFNGNTQRIASAIKESTLFTEYDFSDGPTEVPDYSSAMRLNGGEWKYVKGSLSTGRYFNLLGLQAVEGRLWNDSIDSYLTFGVVINETAKKLLGVTDIETETLEASSFFVFSSDMDRNQKPEYKIIGVVKDFSAGHLSKAVPPMVFYHYETGPNRGVMARVAPTRKQEAIAFLKEKYAEAWGDEFSYTFLDDKIQALYEDDKRLVQVASFFALIAILISSLGLFSLSLFDVQQRFHEISVRKVNGATAADIRWMLLRKYYKLLAVAFLIASPVSWLIITKYTEDFAHKIAPAWWLFATALLLTAAISLLTLIWQIRKAARSNPADVIRSE